MLTPESIVLTPGSTLRGSDMDQRRLGQFDKATGEVLDDGIVVYVPRKRRNGFEGWFAMSNEAVGILKHVTRVDDFRVLMALLEQLDYENLITANQSDIARDLGMDKAQVNRAIKRLVELGAILQGPRVGVSRSYRLNPRFGWKGSARNHVIALDQERKRRGLEVIGGGASAASQAAPQAPERDPNTIDMFDFGMFEGRGLN